MNLYEYSQVNNEEMGVLVVKAEDPALYAEVYAEAMRLIRISDEVRVTVEKVPPHEPDAETKNRKADKAKPAAPESGFCVRCHKTVKADPSHPYCRDCYASWKQYENADYEEKHCHLCGGANKSTMRKPTCYECYRTFKAAFTFPNA